MYDGLTVLTESKDGVGIVEIRRVPAQPGEHDPLLPQAGQEVRVRGRDGVDPVQHAHVAGRSEGQGRLHQGNVVDCVNAGAGIERRRRDTFSGLCLHSSEYLHFCRSRRDF